MATHEQVLGGFLRPYQRRFIEDRSNRITVLKSRRIGMSEAAILSALLEAVTSPGRDIYLTSVSYPDAKELLDRASKWVTTLSSAGIDLGATTILKTRVEFANGSRIVALPADRVRGRGGTVIMDEVAFWQRARDKYAAIAPAADTDPSMRIIMISTPWGEGDLFHEVWTDPEGTYSDWSRHYIDIYDAASEGFPIDPDKLRERYSESTFATEFMCEFSAGVGRYFSPDLMRSAQQHVPANWKTIHWRVGGLDLASKGDATVLATMSGRRIESPDPLPHMSREGVVDHIDVIKPAGKAMDYTDQRHTILRRIEERGLTALVVDGNGEGAQTAQDLARQLTIPVTIVKGSQWLKVFEKVPRLKDGMERGAVRVCPDRDLLRDFASISEEVRAGGTLKFEAKRTPDGHADRFFAVALAYYGLLRAPEPGSKPKGRSRRSRRLQF